MRKLVMSLSVLGGLLFAGTLPATANAAAGLTATHINQSEGLVQKAGWGGGWGHRGWGGGWGHRGWGGGWGDTAAGAAVGVGDIAAGAAVGVGDIVVGVGDIVVGGGA